MIFPKIYPKLLKLVALGSLGEPFQGYGTGLLYPPKTEHFVADRQLETANSHGLVGLSLVLG